MNDKEIIAERIKTLIWFASMLLEDIETIEEFVKNTWTQLSDIMAAAPILWGDYEWIELEKVIILERSKSILKLLKVLKETEDRRQEYKKEKEARDGISKIFNS